MQTKRLLHASLLALLAATTLESQAQPDAKWHTECSSCHVAYPPNGLPAASWKKIMSSLDKHFGADASLAPADNQEIATYLEKNAARQWKSKDEPLRLTETQWFKSKHREVGTAVWKRPAVKSPGNCSACHAGADKGDFDEDRVRIPR